MLIEDRSILDGVIDEISRLNKTLNSEDQDKLDRFATSVREVEQGMQSEQLWLDTPKPEVEYELPERLSPGAITQIRCGLKIAALALETDSTRSITFSLGQTANVGNIPGVARGYHDLSHHGKHEDKLAQLLSIETAFIKEIADFLTQLNSASESGASILDSTLVLVGSGMSNGSSHSCRHLPTLLVGGDRFSHGQHHVVSTRQHKAQPLSNLFVTMLQSLGLEREKVGPSTGTLNQLLKSV